VDYTLQAGNFKNGHSSKALLSLRGNTADMGLESHDAGQETSNSSE
jgi:hypothetical protein